MYIYADEEYAEPECFECQAYDNKIDDIKYWLNFLLDQLYGKEKLNVEECDSFIQEICALVGAHMPEQALAIQIKQKPSLLTYPVSSLGWKNALTPFSSLIAS